MSTPVVLTESELGLLVEALDSHVYWQLSEQKYRREGYVERPGSEDQKMVEEIERSLTLAARLEKLVTKHALECDLDADCSCGASERLLRTHP